MGSSRWGARAACQAKAVAWHLPAAQPPGGYPQRGPAGASVHKPAMLPTKKTCECTHNRTVIVARGFLVDCRPTRAAERPTRCTAGSVSKVEMDCDCCHTGPHFIVSLRKEWPMTFIAVHCPHCQSDQIVKRGKTARGTQRYLCQN